MLSKSAFRVSRRYLQAPRRYAGQIRIEVLAEETEKARRQYGGEIAVGRMLDSVPMYRVMDGDELQSVLKTGKITGGTFSVEGERAYGSQWGSDLSEVARWGDSWRGGRLGHDLFVAEIDGKNRVFAHLSGAGRTLNPDSGIVSLDPKFCNTGLGCSFQTVLGDVVRWFVVEAGGGVNPIPLDDLKALAGTVGAKPRNVDLWRGWSVSPFNLPIKLIKALKHFMVIKEVREMGLQWPDSMRVEKNRFREIGISEDSGMDEEKLSKMLIKELGRLESSWGVASIDKANAEAKPSRADLEEGIFSIVFCFTVNTSLVDHGADLRGKRGTVRSVYVFSPPNKENPGRWMSLWQPFGKVSFSWKGEKIIVR